MVKPSVFAIDPSQEKAQLEKAKEAGQIEVPINTDKFQDELAVKTTEGAKPRGCCASLPRWVKVTIGLIATLLILSCIGLLTYKMLVGSSWCGTDELKGGHHRWDKTKGDLDGQYPYEGGHGDDSHGSSEEHGHGRPGGGSHGEDGDHHHGPGHHGPHGGPDHDGPHGGPDNGPHGGPDHGPHGGPDHGPHGGPDHGPHGGPHPGPHPGPPPSGHPGPHPSGPPGPHPEHGGHEHYEDEDMDERDYP